LQQEGRTLLSLDVKGDVLQSALVEEILVLYLSKAWMMQVAHVHKTPFFLLRLVVCLSRSLACIIFKFLSRSL
jgi:hypothetical protein